MKAKTNFRAIVRYEMEPYISAYKRRSKAPRSEYALLIDEFDKRPEPHCVIPCRTYQEMVNFVNRFAEVITAEAWPMIACQRKEDLTVHLCKED